MPLRGSPGRQSNLTVWNNFSGNKKRPAGFVMKPTGLRTLIFSSTLNHPKHLLYHHQYRLPASEFHSGIQLHHSSRRRMSPPDSLPSSARKDTLLCRGCILILCAYCRNAYFFVFLHDFFYQFFIF